MQKVHFSITPFGRAARRPGLSCQFNGSAPDRLEPVEPPRPCRGSCWSSSACPCSGCRPGRSGPRKLWKAAKTGQTGSQGASSHCWQSTGMKRTASLVSKKRSIQIQAIWRCLRPAPFPRADVVLRVAGRHAGAAARAAVQVHGKGPAVVLVGHVSDSRRRLSGAPRAKPDRQAGCRAPLPASSPTGWGCEGTTRSLAGA